MKKVLLSMVTLLMCVCVIGIILFIHPKDKTIYTYAEHKYVDSGIYIKSIRNLANYNRVEQEPISIIFAGDTLFDWSVRTAIQNNGPDYPFEYVKEEVKQADLAILNLETAVTTQEEKDPIQLYNFKSDPIALEGIKNAGFDMVSLANNHAMDYQIDGFLDTLKHLQSYQIPYFGAGKNYEEAYRAESVVINGKTIKVLGFSRFLPAVRWYESDGPVIASGYQVERVLETIEKEKHNTDYLLVYIHWGVEKNNIPENWQREYARQMIDSGADAIIGSHPHVLQGFEYYKDKPIAYSLGNFLFPDYVTGRTAQTGLLTLTIEGEQLSTSFNPYHIYANQIHPLEGNDDEKVLQYLQDISFDIEINGEKIINKK